MKNTVRSTWARRGFVVGLAVSATVVALAVATASAAETGEGLVGIFYWSILAGFPSTLLVWPFLGSDILPYPGMYIALVLSIVGNWTLAGFLVGTVIASRRHPLEGPR